MIGTTSGPAGYSAGRRRAVLAAVCLALVLVVASVAMLTVAAPAMAADLGASQSEQQWILDAYTLALAALLLPFGAVGDRYGRRGALLAGIGWFAVATGCSALATSAGALIAWRALAGLGAALIMPATLATITSVFPVEERPRAVGVWVGFAGAGAVIGMVGSGALLETFWWGSIFVAVTVFAGLALVAILVTVPPTSSPEHANLDPPGSLLSALAIGALVLGIIEGPERGWSDPVAVGGFVAAAAAAGAFVWWERRAPGPLLDPQLFRARGFATGTVTLLLLFLAMFGFFFIVLGFLQLVLGYGTFKAALLLLPLVLTMLPLSTVAGPLSVRYGMRAVSGLGLVLTAGSFVFMTSIGPGSGYWQLFPGLVMVGGGMALAMTPATNAIVASLPVGKQGVASAVNDAAREIGAALGIAVLGSAFNAAYRSDIGAVARGLPAAAAEAARSGPAGALAVAQQAGPAGGELVSGMRDAFVHGMHAALVAGAALLLLGAIYVWLKAPGPRPPLLPVGSPPAPTTRPGPR